MRWKAIVSTFFPFLAFVCHSLVTWWAKGKLSVTGNHVAGIKTTVVPAGGAGLFSFLLIPAEVGYHSFLSDFLYHGVRMQGQRVWQHFYFPILYH